MIVSAVQPLHMGRLNLLKTAHTDLAEFALKGHNAVIVHFLFRTTFTSPPLIEPNRGWCESHEPKQSQWRHAVLSGLVWKAGAAH